MPETSVRNTCCQNDCKSLTPHDYVACYSNDSRLTWQVFTNDNNPEVFINLNTQLTIIQFTVANYLIAFAIADVTLLALVAIIVCTIGTSVLF